jgi:hypothetical protein
VIVFHRTLAIALAAWCGAFAVTAQDSGARSAGQPAAQRTHPRLDASMFAPSRDCLACHNNLTGPGGEDVSIGASWRGSMMANAARDPYVHASVRRETLDHPKHAAQIEDECAACHLPAARKIAHEAGVLGRVFAHLPDAGDENAIDDLARDGVTCTVCHQIAPDRLGTRSSFNGNFAIAPPLASGRRRAFGPLAPDAGRRRIMHSVTGFEQEQAPHISQSELCATCHTLITEAVGPDGAVIGSLPEQMNYQEWRHSAFDEEGRSCQSCHMPRLPGPVRVASVLGDYRDGLSRHTFLGGNAFMLRLMNRYRAELGVEATPSELEASARATEAQLERDTASVAIEQASIAGETLTLDVLVRNLAGHKFPTGYPSRRAWLHVTVRDRDGRTVFESGRVTDTGSIDGNDSDADPAAYEPHYRQITKAGEVQIYESIMGTPAGAPTTGLLAATQYLKDNRLLPRGFDKRTADATIAVFGAAAADDDFLGGGDRVRYQIAAAGAATVEVELRFQPIGYRWARNLAAYDAREPKAFVSYYESMAASSSVPVARASRAVDLRH